jgi:site-specific DNA-methyltransferase (adenine-specific)
LFNVEPNLSLSNLIVKTIVHMKKTKAPKQNSLFEELPKSNLLQSNADSSKKNPEAILKDGFEFVGPFKLNDVYECDAISSMALMPDASVDLAVIDPPYNVSQGGEWKWDNSKKLPGLGGNWDKVIEDWDKFELKDYFEFTMAWALQIKRIVKPEGSIWIHGTYHNIGLINFIFQLLKIEIINEVIWYKRNSFPNLSGRRLTASHETIIWAHTGKKRKYAFNYEFSKLGSFEGDNLKAEGKQMRTVWDIPNNKAAGEMAAGKHPTQKPLKLIKRMIQLSATPEQIVFSPFAGSGTDCLAAKELGMYYLGFDMKSEYVELAKRRLSGNVKVPTDE